MWRESLALTIDHQSVPKETKITSTAVDASRANLKAAIEAAVTEKAATLLVAPFIALAPVPTCKRISGMTLEVVAAPSFRDEAIADASSAADGSAADVSAADEISELVEQMRARRMRRSRSARSQRMMREAE